MRKAPPKRGLSRRTLLGAAEALEALVELLDAAGRVHDALLARVERVRGRRDLDVDDGVLDTVELDRLVAGNRRTGEERLARTEVAEHDRLVVGVDVSLHGKSFEMWCPGFCQSGRSLRCERTKERFYQPLGVVVKRRRRRLSSLRAPSTCRRSRRGRSACRTSRS